MARKTIRPAISSTFSRPQLVAFIILFGIVGGIYLFRSFAATTNGPVGDLNNDGVVNILDVSILLSNYGTTNAIADINSDGTVNVLDLSILLSHYGQTASAGAPTITISATPTTIAPGQSAALTWSTTNATSCTATGGWNGSKPTSGSTTIIPSSTATYTLSCSGNGGSAQSSATITVTQFVQRSGANLTLNGQLFRFAGTNIPWLGMLEHNGGVYPTKFDIDDALDTAKEMGVTVVRSHSLGISVGCASYSTPYNVRLEPTRNTFNDAAFNTIDYSIFQAGQHGIRLVIPLTDGNTPCFYDGCIRTFVDWVHPGSTDDTLFQTDATIVSDFKTYVSHILNHVNPYTGLALKNDPTIMAWESGNEYDTQDTNMVNWTTAISQYVKSIDAKHLFIDGGWDMGPERLSIATVDMYTRHYYHAGWFYPGGTGTAIVDYDHYGCTAVAANKVFFIGEYDWTEQSTTPLKLSTFLPNVQNYQCPGTTTYASAGDLYWSLYGHAPTNGFRQHGDGYTLHYLGDASWMRTQAQLLRTHAYAMDGLPAPTPVALTRAPLLRTPVASGGMQLNWQGVANAAYYQIERSNNNGSTWTVISPGTSPADGTVGGLTDNDDQANPWVDPGGTSSSKYRIRAFNAANAPGPYSSGYDNTTSTAPKP